MSVGAAAACFDPTYSEGATCSEAATCPPGMVCDPADKRCRHEALGSTCSDEQQNGGETGVDCGGECPPCPGAVRDAIVQSSGGGAALSAGYQVQLSIGAPQPMGSGASSTFNATLGPGAARP